MIATYFVLTLYCLSCDPVQVTKVPGIEASDPGGSLVDADSNCQDAGYILSGEYRRHNMYDGSVKGQIAATKDWITFTCEAESGEF